MKLYEVSYLYTVTEEDAVRLDAEDDVQAEERAVRHIAEHFPERQDVEILEVDHING